MRILTTRNQTQLWPYGCKGQQQQCRRIKEEAEKCKEQSVLSSKEAQEISGTTDFKCQSQKKEIENLHLSSKCSCLPMPTNRECCCCCEIPEMESEMREAGVTCITSHPGFQTVCLDVYALKTAYYQYGQQYGHKVADLNNRYCYTAYRQLTRFIWGYLGEDIRVTLPSCAVLTIRKQFPSVDGIYTGYLEPQ